MKAQNVRLFESILVRQAPWKGLGGATFAVALAYIVMLCAAVLLSKPDLAREKRRPRPLVVTLFDAARIQKLRSLEDTGGAAKGLSGAPDSAGPSVGASAPMVASPKQRALPETHSAREKPKPKPQTRPKEQRPEVAGSAAQPEMAVPAPAPVAPVVASGAESTAALTGPTASAGSGSGGQGGSPSATHGAGSGSGSGSGGGAKAGVASGDTKVMPFMDGMTRPSVVSKVDPEYTREARDANVQGLILTKCVITMSGQLRNCRIVKGVPLMDQAVLKALSQWRYTPVTYQGKPVDVEYVIPVRLVMQ